MQTCRRILPLVAMIIFSMPVFAQQTDDVIAFANGNFVTGSNVRQKVLQKESLTSARFGSQYFGVIQFVNLPGKRIVNELKNAGVQLHTYLPGRAYLATIGAGFNFASASLYNISSINVVPAFYKLSPELLQYKAGSKNDIRLIAVTTYPTIDRATAVQQISNAGGFISTTKFDQEHLIFIQASQTVINTIAALPFVSTMRLQSLTDKPLNYNNVAANGISNLSSPVGRKLDGKGVTIGIGDNADVNTHIDFSARLINRHPYSPSYHGTHVAGTAGGAGIINIRNRGMAPRSLLVNQVFSNIISYAPVYVADYNMVLTNNSYYLADDGCGGEGAYDVFSILADGQMGQYPQLMHVIAAGNDGGNSCAGYPASFATIKSGLQCAKNVLTVGALNTDDYVIGSFSSRGPLKDGRLKPELTTGGVGVISTATFDGYGSSTGTSMAAPTTTGSLALLYQRYRQLHGGTDPSAALVKTLACNTAEDLGNAGPDFTFGFGMLNARRAADAMEGNRYIINSVAPGGNNTHVIAVPANTRRLKIMLYWADTAAADNAAAALVNDLDLSVSEPSTLLHRPLILNSTTAGVNNIAVEGIDRVNNIEQVVIENPAAGNYTIRVNGFIVPFGSQQYVISYELVQPSVTVEYPFGGEKWVPGETENLRWSAYGNEANNFTIEYSINNGSNWTVVDNNVPASSRKYPLVVPGSATNQALVRISRNGTALSDQSDFNFTILGSPVVTASNVCEGAVQLNWNAITGATSYDILQLSADTMQVIGNTSSNTWLIKGLDKNKTTWFGVAAKNGSFSGRRSISISALPNAGACTLPTFNNDLKVDTILEPITARQGFSNAGNAVKPVKIVIRNLGSISVSGPFNVSYNYGAAIITESISPTIAAGGIYTYTFTGMYPVVPTGYSYDFKAWITLGADGNHLNDTTYKTVRYLNNDAIVSLPLAEGFESMPVVDFTRSEMGIGNNKRLDFSPSSNRGRARPFVNSGFAFTGTQAMTLDQSPYNSVNNADSLTLSYNLSNYLSKQLRFDFYYKNHAQDDAPANKVWIRGSEGSAWVQAYELFANQSGIGNWKRAIINVNDVLNSAVPVQSVSSTFQVRIGQEGKTSANVAVATLDADDGYTFDDLTLTEVLNDVAVIKIIAPDINGCSLSATNPVSIRVKNYNNATLNNLTVSYRINGGAIVTENIASLGPNQSIDYLFTQTANLSALQDYNVQVWVKYPGDSYAANDSITDFTVRNSPVISTYPYLQNFESSDGNFYTKGINSSWQWGLPVNNIISKAASGAKAWVTNLAGNYNDTEESYLISPCFDIHTLLQPVLSFSHILSTELDFDYSWVEYSTDGQTWQKLGTSGAGTNWYDEPVLDNWAASNYKWHVASFNLPVSATTIRFRFVLKSDAGITEEGIGIDDIHVFDKAPVYSGVPVTGISQPVSGSNWVDFTSGGNRIVSINANGINLGSTMVQVHPYGGAVRNSKGQYYANRNIVVRPTIPPTGPVKLRFYFTDTEAQSLVNATGCGTCTTVLDPYVIGIAQYSGNIGDENGNLDDDTTGLFNYILPANTTVVPYDNGYYAEYTVNSFSEFWLSGGNIQPDANGVCPGSNITFKAATTGGSYQWQENSGAGYHNISNGGNYAGTNTATLQLVSLPTSFSGTRYRCVVDGIVGNENAVRFTAVWNGNASNNWFVGANWSCGIVPDQYTDVIIPGGLSVYPLINATTAVRSIGVHPGAIVTVSSAVNLQLKGN